MSRNILSRPGRSPLYTSYHAHGKKLGKRSRLAPGAPRANCRVGISAKNYTTVSIAGGISWFAAGIARASPC